MSQKSPSAPERLQDARNYHLEQRCNRSGDAGGSERPGTVTETIIIIILTNAVTVPAALEARRVPERLQGDAKPSESSS